MRIVSIVNTNHSLPFDDRVNKESMSLIKYGHSVSIIALESKNAAAKGQTSYGASFRTLSLITRKWFSSGKLVAVKLLEWNFRVILILFRKKWDVLWVNDYDALSTIIYGRFIKIFAPNRKIIWDHHELVPERFLRSRFYRWLISCSDIIIHANSDRVAYTQSRIPVKYATRFFVLENYPDADFADMKTQSINNDFSSWLKNDTYCLFQGAALTYRKVIECIEAVMHIDNMRLLIMGPCDDNTRGLIEKKWPDYRDKVFITGWIPQSSFVEYMDDAVASLVFYENIDTNHWLCAPNRFFNAILRDIPIICGSNPPMKRIVESEDLGYVCKNNGEDYTEIVTGIKQIQKRYRVYKDNCILVSNKYIWQNQEKQFDQILSDRDKPSIF